MNVPTDRVDYLRLLQLQACVESSVRALRLGLGCHAAGLPKQAAIWYERGSSSIAFGYALAEYLRVRRCRAFSAG